LDSPEQRDSYSMPQVPEPILESSENKEGDASWSLKLKLLSDRWDAGKKWWEEPA